MAKPKRPPSIGALLSQILKQADKRPVAFVLAGHNGSGKSTLWKDRLAPTLRVPLINADRLITSILPAPESRDNGFLVPWAAKLRDEDARWQGLAQEGVNTFLGLVTERKMAFGFETVFSHWKALPDGTFESKIDVITSLQAKGYFAVLIFVGLASVQVSILRVKTRVQQGGHSVGLPKLQQRFPRTQRAVGQAALVADMTLMFDNSLGLERAFEMARVQQKQQVLYDCRDPAYSADEDMLVMANMWLDKVCGPFVAKA
ncbi:MAG: toxin [Polaromonas sp.]|nr:toxin [Polaromonas sp.]